MYTVLLTKAVLRDLDRPIPEKIKNSLAEAIDKLANDPYPLNVRKLKGVENLRRIDVGEFRILFSVLDRNKTVTIVKVGDRKDVYRFLKR